MKINNYQKRTIVILSFLFTIPVILVLLRIIFLQYLQRDDEYYLNAADITYRYTKSIYQMEYPETLVENDTKNDLIQIFFHSTSESEPQNQKNSSIFNFVTEREILAKLAVLSKIKIPLQLFFFNCNINTDVVQLLRDIPEIQILCFDRCSFNTVSLDNIRTNRLFKLRLSKCNAQGNWPDILRGINYMYGLEIYGSDIMPDDLRSIFSPDMNIRNIDIRFMNIPSGLFQNINSLPNINSVKIYNSYINDDDILTLINTPKIFFYFSNRTANPVKIPNFGSSRK
jgi:hypothetical protein